jgi:hypothetical protein
VTLGRSLVRLTHLEQGNVHALNQSLSLFILALQQPQIFNHLMFLFLLLFETLHVEFNSRATSCNLSARSSAAWTDIPYSFLLSEGHVALYCRLPARSIKAISRRKTLRRGYIYTSGLGGFKYRSVKNQPLKLSFRFSDYGTATTIYDAHYLGAPAERRIYISTPQSFSLSSCRRSDEWIYF